MGFPKMEANRQLSNCFLCPWFQQRQGGFTLLELMIVMIILSILSAIALPSFLNQVGKTRETDAKIRLGSIARAQQAYHFEKATFSATMNSLSLDSASLASKYYNFPDPSVANSSIVQHKAIPLNANIDWVKNYATAVYFNAGYYEIVFCQGSEVGADVETPNIATGPCSNNGIKIY